jgi:hypothetical protein
VPAPISPQRARLGRRLRELRAAAFPSGGALAEHLRDQNPDSSWHQTRVFKLERGEQRPTEADLEQWVTATGSSVDELERLNEMLAAARIAYATHRDAFRAHGGAAGDQASIGIREVAATWIAGFQLAMMPGLVQTAAYAREVLSQPCGPIAHGTTEDEIEGMVSARIKRQEVLYQPGRQIHLLLGEAALRTKVGTLATLIGQLDRLVAVAGLDTVELGIVPFTAVMPIHPLGGFTIHDDVVFIESLAGEQTVDDPGEVAIYVKAFDLLRDAALTGPDAVALIQRVAAQLRDGET